MGTDIWFNCETCGQRREQNPGYCRGQHQRFCSKSCRMIFTRRRWHSKQEIHRAAVQAVKGAGRYLTQKELMRALACSDSTLRKFGLSVVKINKEAGVKKPPRLFEYLVGISIRNLFPGYSVETQKDFPDLLGSSGYRPLHYDFYLPELRLLIEADSNYHTDPNSANYERTVLHDKMKTEYAEQRGDHLVRIPYSRAVDDDYVRPFVENFLPLQQRPQGQLRQLKKVRRKTISSRASL